MRRLAAAFLAAVALSAPAAAAAADCPRTTLGDVEDEVMCPVCGTPLDLAIEAPQAQQERAFIERLIARCESKSEIKRALVAQFGEEVLALPGDEQEDDLGDVLAYLVPALALLLGTAGIGFAVVRWRRRRRGPEPPSAPSGAAAARLDEDLERYDL